MTIIERHDASQSLIRPHFLPERVLQTTLWFVCVCVCVCGNKKDTKIIKSIVPLESLHPPMSSSAPLVLLHVAYLINGLLMEERFGRILAYLTRLHRTRQRIPGQLPGIHQKLLLWRCWLGLMMMRLDEDGRLWLLNQLNMRRLEQLGRRRRGRWGGRRRGRVNAAFY